MMPKSNGLLPRPSCWSAVAYDATSDFRPEKELRHNDYWFEVDGDWKAENDPRISKEEKDEAVIDVDKGEKTYTAGIETIRFRDGGTARRFYVLHEVATRKERHKLAPFCDCASCESLLFPLSLLVYCPCCHGCVASGMSSDARLKRVRGLYETRKGVPPSTWYRARLWVAIGLIGLFFALKAIVTKLLLY